MKNGTHFKQINQKDFDLVKICLEKGFSKAQIKGITNRAHSTVMLIDQAKDLADYKQLVSNLRKKKQAVANGHVEMPIEEPKEDTLLGILHRINENLERMADAWETPEKKQVISHWIGGGGTMS